MIFDFAFDSKASLKECDYGARLMDDGRVILPQELGKKLGRAGIVCRDLDVLLAAENDERIADALMWPGEYVAYARRWLQHVLFGTGAPEKVERVIVRGRNAFYRAFLIGTDRYLQDVVEGCMAKRRHRRWKAPLLRLWIAARQLSAEHPSVFGALTVARRRIELHRRFKMVSRAHFLGEFPSLEAETLALREIRFRDYSLWYQSELLVDAFYAKAA